MVYNNGGCGGKGVSEGAVSEFGERSGLVSFEIVLRFFVVVLDVLGHANCYIIHSAPLATRTCFLWRFER